MSYKSGCMVCGQELEYLPEVHSLVCAYCGKTFQAEVRCQAGHYICDNCHGLSANDLIETYCQAATGEDPLEMAVTLMRNPVVKMHGPEHHFLVPAVLLAAYYNHLQDPAAKEGKLKKARKRAEEVKGGFCGTHGSCGAGMGTGIFISLVTGATPLSHAEWRLSNLMTAQSLMRIAECGGPRCCKRDTYLALHSATDFLRDTFQVNLPTTRDFSCEFSAFNRECLGNECQFFKNS